MAQSLRRGEGRGGGDGTGGRQATWSRRVREKEGKRGASRYAPQQVHSPTSTPAHRRTHSHRSPTAVATRIHPGRGGRTVQPSNRAMRRTGSSRPALFLLPLRAARSAPDGHSGGLHALIHARCAQGPARGAEAVGVCDAGNKVWLRRVPDELREEALGQHRVRGPLENLCAPCLWVMRRLVFLFFHLWSRRHDAQSRIAKTIFTASLLHTAPTQSSPVDTTSPQRMPEGRLQKLSFPTKSAA